MAEQKMAGRPTKAAQPDDLRKLRQHQRVLMELAHLATFELPFSKLLPDAVALVGGAVEVSHVKVLQYRPASADLLVVAGAGWKSGVVDQATFAIDLASPPGRAFRTGQPVAINGLAESTEFRLSAVLREHGIVSLLNVPIQIDGGTWGVLEVDSTQHRDFTLDTQDFLLTAASILATAIRRDQAYRLHGEALAAAAQEAQKNRTLMTEMQHRMKNNFQTILSMVTIQRTRLQSPEGRESLARIAEGISAMALAHDQLALDREGDIVHLPTYLKALTASIQTLETVTIETHADEIILPVERAVPVGLIVNELVTNCVKHAFDEDGGAVRISLETSSGTGRIRLRVADNGRGLEGQGKGTGTKLIDALCLQLRGRVERSSSEQGTTVEVTFAP
jgi:two-component system, sensor histidine kinase PdtaS